MVIYYRSSRKIVSKSDTWFGNEWPGAMGKRVKRTVIPTPRRQVGSAPSLVNSLYTCHICGNSGFHSMASMRNPQKDMHVFHSLSFSLLLSIISMWMFQEKYRLRVSCLQWLHDEPAASVLTRANTKDSLRDKS